MTSSKEEKNAMSNERSKCSILAPSKFSLSSESCGNEILKCNFPGLKASKLSTSLLLKSISTSSDPLKKEVDSEDRKEDKKGMTFLPLTKDTASEKGVVNPESVKETSEVDDLNGSCAKQGENDLDSTFIFGQNLEDRAKNFIDAKKESAKAAEKDDDSDKDAGGTRVKKSLNEAAAEYQEAHSIKRKYEEVAVKTGEEDEHNVIQMSAKLHTFDKSTGSWLEKGRGMLRLNDMLDSSRLIMRSAGVLKVILNTKIFHGMSWEKPTEKSIRLTGIDDEGAVKIYLLSGSSKDMEKLFDFTKSRLDKLSADSNKKIKKLS